MIEKKEVNGVNNNVNGVRVIVNWGYPMWTWAFISLILRGLTCTNRILTTSKVSIPKCTQVFSKQEISKNRHKKLI